MSLLVHDTTWTRPWVLSISDSVRGRRGYEDYQSKRLDQYSLWCYRAVQIGEQSTQPLTSSLEVYIVLTHFIIITD
jgi:hypothetical protein